MKTPLFENGLTFRVYHILLSYTTTLEGTATITCGDQTWSASPGDYVFLPRGILHSFKVVGATPLKLEVISSPGGPLGFEHLVEELGEPAKTLTLPPLEPLDRQKIVTLAAKYHIEIPL